jgi:hypothetical protein
MRRIARFAHRLAGERSDLIEPMMSASDARRRPRVLLLPRGAARFRLALAGMRRFVDLRATS